MLYLILNKIIMNEWLESATPNSATHYASINLQKASDRQAGSDIIKATSSLIKQNKTVRKKLQPELCESKKSAVSR